MLGCLWVSTECCSNHFMEFSYFLYGGSHFGNEIKIQGGVMSDKYLKVILVSAVGGLYMIAYSLFYIGGRISM